MNGTREVLAALKYPFSQIEEPPVSEPPETVTPESAEQCETDNATINLVIPSKASVELGVFKEAEAADCMDKSSVHSVVGGLGDEGDGISTKADGEVGKGESIMEHERKAEGESLVAPEKDNEGIDGGIHVPEEKDVESVTIKAEELSLIAEEHEKLICETGSPAGVKEGEKETVKVELLTPVTDGYGELTSEGETLASQGTETEGVVVKVVLPVLEKGGKSSEGHRVECAVEGNRTNGEKEVPPVEKACPISDTADDSEGELEEQTVVKQGNGIEVQEATAQSNAPYSYLFDEDKEVEDEDNLELDNSQLIGDDSLQMGTDNRLIREKEAPIAHTEMEIEETESDVVKSGSGGKQKRPRNSKSQAKTPNRKTIGEDVCFICLDGGELVLCDRRGCPKAYHPSCVDRDEAFFKSKGRWNCGWHICSKCQKNAYYMCYACTFSLCKGCVKDAEFSCIRGNKGLCEACMETVMLIEKKDQGNDDTAIFNDESSWEYLFKDYWTELKGKLSLTFDELALVKNPRKGSTAKVKTETPAEVNDDDSEGESGSDTSLGNVEASNVKRKKTKKRLKSAAREADSDKNSSLGKPGASSGKRNAQRILKSQPKEVDLDSDDSYGNHDGNANERKKAKKLLKSHGAGVGLVKTGARDNSQWASKTLLNFVMHMKNGDKSILSQYDVQELLLEYIKRNKLRDPRRRSQIVCDPMLQRLFGKPRVGHFEMLKLLESHFLWKEDSQAEDNQGSAVDNEDAGVNLDLLADAGKPRGKKLRRRGSDRGFQSNVDDYAAIDMHNISLICLRRNLLEALVEDSERFQDKVVGCFVRIRISANTQKQDIYRLVQVIGTCKAAGPYKVGKGTTDDMLEILNLDKTEVISIDTISNQDFSEEECKRLRQSIKCGLISRLTVGDILDKARELQEDRVKDWLETETLRISHLRDRASDLGRKKELRECVEKLQLLKTPEEQQRRLEEIPEVHADPNMDPNYNSESEADDRNQESKRRPRGRDFFRGGRDQFTSQKGGYDFNDSQAASAKPSSKKWEMSRHLSGKGSSGTREDAVGAGGASKRELWNQEVDTSTPHLSSGEKSKIASDTVTGKQAENSGKRTNMSRAAALESSFLPCNSVAEPETKIIETEKLWHYRDPSAKAQGPFSMMQLRKWSNARYFPPDLQIWKTAQSEDQSILLTEALAGRFQKNPCLVGASFSDNPGLQISHVSPASTGNEQGTNTLKINQNLGSGNASSMVSSGGSTPSMARTQSDISSKVSFSDTSGSDYGGKNDSSNRPSSTPNRRKSRWSTPDPPQHISDVLASPTAAVLQVRQYTNASSVASHEPTRGAQHSSREAAAVPSAGTGPSYPSMQRPGISSMANRDSSNSLSGNAPQMPLQTIGAIQSVGGQNPPNYYQGWGPSYPNAMPAQQPTYSPWSNGNTPATYNAGQSAALGNFSTANFQGTAYQNQSPWGSQRSAAPQNIWGMAVPTNPGVAPIPLPNMGWVGAAQSVSSVGAAFVPSQGQVIGAAVEQPAAPTAVTQGPMPGNTNLFWPNTLQMPSVGYTGQSFVAPTGNPGTWGK